MRAALAAAAALAALTSCAPPPPTPSESPHWEPQRAFERAGELLRGAEYSAAVEVIDEALEGASGPIDRLLEARLLARKGHALANGGSLARSRDTLRSAAALLEGDTEPRLEAEANRIAASVALLSGRRDEALEAMGRARKLFLAAGDEPEAAATAGEHAIQSAISGQHAEAIAIGTPALATLEAAGRVPEALRTRGGLAYALHQLGRDEEAEAAYDTLIERSAAINDQQSLRFAYCNRAELRQRRGSEGPAEADLRRAIEGFERGRSRVSGARERARYLGLQVEAYGRLVLLLANTYRGLEAFEIAERFHARSFLEVLATRAGAGAIGDPTLAQRERQLLTGLGRAALSEGGGPLPETAAAAIDALEAELSTLHEAARAELGESDPPQPLGRAEVQAALAEDEALVAYWLAEDRLLAWAMSRDEAYLVQVPVSRAEITAATAAWLDPLRSPRRAEDTALAGMEPRHLEHGVQLHDWLFGHLPSIVHTARTVILVPDGVLHYLPFESLPIACSETEDDGVIHGSYRSCRFLGLEKSIAYNPSASAFAALRQRTLREPEATGAVLALAPRFVSRAETPGAELRSALALLSPLAEAEAEARKVAELFPRGHLLVAGSATEARFKREAPSYRFLHLATHGLVRDDRPMSSGLLLAPGDRDDGLLSAHEVLGLDLSAEVVTLSACRSGRGELSRGEGLVGLTQAFLAAGASSVVVSLWDVDDRSTAILMAELYRQLATSEDRAQALAQARQRLFEASTDGKLVFRTRPMAYAHPRFWAPFILVGAPS